MTGIRRSCAERVVNAQGVLTSHWQTAGGAVPEAFTAALLVPFKIIVVINRAEFESIAA